MSSDSSGARYVRKMALPAGCARVPVDAHEGWAWLGTDRHRAIPAIANIKKSRDLRIRKKDRSFLVIEATQLVVGLLKSVEALTYAFRLCIDKRGHNAGLFIHMPIRHRFYLSNVPLPDESTVDAI
jgi:hypothetical protein